MLVPQANLIAKVKKNGKSVQYRDQIDKIRGEQLYNMFVKSVEGLLIEHQQKTKTTTNNTTTKNKSNRNNTKTDASKNNSTSYKENATTTTVDPSIPPKELFRYRQKQQQQQQEALLYGSFDDSTGFPLTTADDGQPLTKSATKRTRKLYDAHAKRHEKYLLKQQQEQRQQNVISNHPDENHSATPTATFTAATIVADPAGDRKSTDNNGNNGNSSSDNDVNENKTKKFIENTNTNDRTSTTTTTTADAALKLDRSFVQLIAGSFGKRQGLEFVSDMGPFCHVIEL